MTLNLSIGFANPYGEKDYVKLLNTGEPYAGTSAEVSPHLMSNFGTGLVLTGGIQINPNRRFSLAFNLQYLRIKKWDYEYEWNFMDSNRKISGSWMDWHIRESHLYPDGDYNTILESGSNTLGMNNISLGVMPKFYLLPDRQINPYILAELNFNYMSLKLENNYGSALEKYEISLNYNQPLQDVFDNTVSIGVYPGIGADVRINDNLSAFLQTGLLYILVSNNKLSESGFPAENFKCFKMEAGIKFSFLRSKNL